MENLKIHWIFIRIYYRMADTTNECVKRQLLTTSLHHRWVSVVKHLKKWLLPVGGVLAYNISRFRAYRIFFCQLQSRLVVMVQPAATSVYPLGAQYTLLCLTWKICAFILPIGVLCVYSIVSSSISFQLTLYGFFISLFVVKDNWMRTVATSHTDSTNRAAAAAAMHWSAAEKHNRIHKCMCHAYKRTRIVCHKHSPHTVNIHTFEARIDRQTKPNEGDTILVRQWIRWAYGKLRHYTSLLLANHVSRYFVLHTNRLIPTSLSCSKYFAHIIYNFVSTVFVSECVCAPSNQVLALSLSFSLSLFLYLRMTPHPMEMITTFF